MINTWYGKILRLPLVIGFGLIFAGIAFILIMGITIFGDLNLNDNSKDKT